MTCIQVSEEKPACTRRSLVYEHICTKCNPDATKKGDLEMINMDTPSIYVGETARSIKERTKEHWEAYRSSNKDSHILKHWTLHHDSVGEPEFIMKVVGFHRTALSRQVGEAVRIMRRGLVLNSKSEFSRCKITRLSLEQLDKEKEQEVNGSGLGEELLKDWSRHMLDRRDKVDKDSRQRLGRVSTSESSKRIGAAQEPTRRVKKRKYELVGEDWGLIDEEGTDVSAFLHSMLLGDGGRGASTTTPPPPLVNGKPFENYSEDHNTSEKGTVAVSVGRAECDENSVSRSPKIQAGLCVQQDEIGQAECVRVNGNCIEKETGGTVKVKSRVWTKLRNGTYAWRTRMITRKRTRGAEIVRTGEPFQTSGGLSKWVPAELLTVGNKLLLLGSPKKRKYSYESKNKSEGEIRAVVGESESLGLDYEIGTKKVK